MALSKIERRLIERAMLEALIGDLVTQIRADDLDGIHSTLGKLQKYQLESEFDELKEEAEDAQSAAISGIMQDALDNLARIASNLGPLGKSLAEARDIAKRGKKELTIPSISAHATQALASFETLFDAVEKIRVEATELGETDDLRDTADIMKDLIDQLKALKNSVS